METMKTSMFEQAGTSDRGRSNSIGHLSFFTNNFFFLIAKFEHRGDRG